MLIDYSTGWVAPRRRIEKKTTSQSSAEAPSYTMGAIGLSACQGTSETKNMLCPSTHRAPMYLQKDTQGGKSLLDA